MFTGIIKSMGHFKGFNQGRREMLLEALSMPSALDPGTSLAVNGVCLSLVRKEKTIFVFNVSRETLLRTNIGSLRPGCRLNLELPVTPSSFLGGHIVTGHVDGLGKVIRMTEKRPGKRMRVSFPPDLRPLFIPQGSVAINGVSLTVAGLEAAALEAEIIPLTLKDTNLGDLRAGDGVNLECDIIGKYVYNWMSLGTNRMKS